jgi:sodium transport system permease protein
MIWPAIFAVLRKELRETMRDRRTLIIMIVVPVLLYPMMLVMVEQIALFGQRSLEAAAVRAAVVGTGRALDFLETEPGITIVQREDEEAAVAALREGSLDAVLILPEEAWAETGTNPLRLVFDAARERSAYAHATIRQRLGAWSDTLVQERLGHRGLSPELATPISLEAESIASPSQVGGYMLGRFLPLLLILMTVLGAFYPSIDLAAGEKERGTLEALLTVPVPADHLVIGKFAAAALMGLTAAALNLGSMLLTFQSGLVRFGEAANLQFQLPGYSALLILGVLALLAILFSALFLGIAVRSHSFKEAQNALTPVYILSLIPAMLPMMPGVEFSIGFALVPVAGVGFLFRELMMGSARLAPAVVAVAATTCYAALALVFAARAFGREDILFGTGAAGSTPGRTARQPVPGPAAALGLAAAAALLFFYGGRPLAATLGEAGIAVSQLLFLAVPALLLLRVGRFDARQTLALRRPTGAAVAGAMLIVLGAIPVAWLIAWLQSFVLDLPIEFLELMQQFLRADSLARLLWLLLVVALLPAVCEELVFRGVLLHGLGSRLRAWQAIVLSAVIFGAFHLSFETAVRFLPTAWLGLVIGFVVWNTRSILPGMLMHLLNNAFVVLILFAPPLRERLMGTASQPPWLLIAVAPLFLYAGWRVLPRRSRSDVHEA